MASSSGKQERTMPVEFAIRRELEYRKVVASFHSRPFTQEAKLSNDASCPKLLPGPSSVKFSSLSGTKRKESMTRSVHNPRLKHQQPFHGSLNHEAQTGSCGLSLNVKPSNDASLPKPLPGPSSSKFSTLLGTKGKELPTRSVHHPHLQQQQPFHRSFNQEVKPDDLYCKICQITCSSPFNLKQHLRGQKHKQMLQKGGNNSSQMQWCELCRIPCMNEDLLKMHFQGRKHKAKLQMLEISKCGGSK